MHHTFFRYKLRDHDAMGEVGASFANVVAEHTRFRRITGPFRKPCPYES